MLEFLYKSPSDPDRESALTEAIRTFGGQLSCREEPDGIGAGPVTLTYEFDAPDAAEKALCWLRAEGEHVEGPIDYGEAEPGRLDDRPSRPIDVPGDPPISDAALEANRW